MSGAAAAATQANFGSGGLSSISLFSSTFASAETIAWPGGIQAGDVAILSDEALSVGTVTPVTPSGFTGIVSVGGASNKPLHMLSRKILDGTETGSITGMNGGLGNGKLLRIFRGNKPIVSVTASSWNSEATDGDPSSQAVAAPSAAPAVVIGMAYGSSGSETFSTASPAFDATQAYGTGATSIGGYKIYNSAPAGHTIDAVDNNINMLASGSLIFA